MRGRWVVVLPVVLLAVLALAGCSKSTPKASGSPSAGSSAQPSVEPSTAASASPSAASAAIAGNWNGTFTVNGEAGQGTFTVTFATVGNALTGKIHINNSTCVRDGTVTGTLSGSQINFGGVRGVRKIGFTGALAGDKLAGTYSAQACPVPGSGTWSATRA